MSEENKILEYDEDDSLKFIQNHLPEEFQESFQTMKSITLWI